MKTLSLMAMLSLIALPSFCWAADAHVIKDTFACENIGWFEMMDKYKPDSDEVALRKYKAHGLHTGQCRTIKKGTRVIFYHFSQYTDGDYGDMTTVRRAGDTQTWVLKKCSLDARDTDLARFPEYTLPEKPCAQ